MIIEKSNAGHTFSRRFICLINSLKAESNLITNTKHFFLLTALTEMVPGPTLKVVPCPTYIKTFIVLCSKLKFD